MKKYLIERDNLILAELDPKAKYLMIVDKNKGDELEGLRIIKDIGIQVLLVDGSPREVISFVKVPKALAKK